MNTYGKQEQSHRHGKQPCGYQREEEKEEGQIGGMGLTDVNYYTHTKKQISHKRALQTTGSDSHHPVIIYNSIIRKS